MDITAIIIYLKGLIGTVLSFLLMLSPVAPVGEAFGAQRPDELVTSFSVVSDCHIETNNPDAYNAFRGLLAGIKAGEDTSTAVFLGDNVMNGQELENIFFYGALTAVKPAENNLVVMGNHDIGNGQGDYNSLYQSYLSYNHVLTGERHDNSYYYKVIDGCYFIVLGIEDLSVNETVISEEQLFWLEGVLDEAEAADAQIFVFNHHPMTYVTGDDKTVLANLLDDYDDVMYFHGHNHYKLEASSFYTQNGIPVINLPRATEVVDYEPGAGVVVEVYEDEVVVRGRNFVTGEWIDGLEYTY